MKKLTIAVSLLLVVAVLISNHGAESAPKHGKHDSHEEHGKQHNEDRHHKHHHGENEDDDDDDEDDEDDDGSDDDSDDDDDDDSDDDDGDDDDDEDDDDEDDDDEDDDDEDNDDDDDDDSHEKDHCPPGLEHGRGPDGHGPPGLRKKCGREGKSKEHGSKEHHRKKHGSKEHGSKEHGSKEHGSKEHGSKEHAGKHRHEVTVEPLSPVDRETLTTILVFIKTQSSYFTGDIIFKNTYYPVDFIETVVLTRVPNFNEITVDKLWYIFNIYSEYFESSSSEYSVASYVVYFLNKNPSITSGSISFQGNTIPVSYVTEHLRNQGLKTKDANPFAVSSILSKYVQENPPSTSTQTTELEDTPTQEQEQLTVVVLKFLKTQGSNPDVTFTFFGHTIEVHDVYALIKTQADDIQELTPLSFYKYLVQYIRSSKENATESVQVPDDKAEQAERILKFLQLQGDRVNGVISIANENIPTDFILTYINLQFGNSIQDADVQNLYQAIEEFSTLLNMSPNFSPQDTVPVFVMDTLKDNPEVTGNVNYNGYDIPIQSIVDGLNEEGYGTDNANIKMIRNILQTEVSNMATASENEVTLSEEPSDDQKKELNVIVEFLKTQEGLYNGSILFSGYNIPYSIIEGNLNGKNQLTAEDLYQVILNYVHSNPRPQMTQEERASLENVLEALQTEGDNVQGKITYDGQQIPTSYFLTVIELHQLSISEVNIDQLYQFAQEYLKLQNSPNGQEDTTGIPEDKVVVIEYILQSLKSGGEDGDIVYEGKKIPKQIIIQILSIQEKDLQELSPSELYMILEFYVQSNGGSSSDNVQVPQESEEELETLVQTLQKEGENSQGSAIVAGRVVSLSQVWQIIKLESLDVQQLNSLSLWRIISILTINQQVSSTDPKQVLYNLVISELQSQGSANAATYRIFVSGQEIPLEYFVEVLNLQKDSSGHYDTSQVSESQIIEAIQGYASYLQKQRLLEAFRQGAAQSGSNTKITFNYNGMKVPLQYLIQELNLERDSDGRVNTDNVTVDDLIKALASYENHPTTTPQTLEIHLDS